MLPQARTNDLVIQELADETLVYDLKRHRAYCLNRTAALVWRECDGRVTVADMARHLEDELKAPVDESVVWLALNRLDSAQLLQERIARPADRTGYSRREVMRKLGLVGTLAVVLPIVQSIAAPTAASAVTCVASNACAGKPSCTPCGPGSGACTKVCWKGNCVGKSLSGCP